MSVTLTPEYWITALLLACLAVCWADVLVRPGMLLAPVQAWLKGKWRTRPFIQKALAGIAGLENRLGNAPDETQAQQIAMLRFELQQAQELETFWWWAPAWGCFKCVAGQAGFWGYLLLFTRLQWPHHLPYLSGYHLLAHLGFAAITIILSFILRKWTTE